MNTEKLHKGKRIFIVTNKYSLTDSRILGTVENVVDWQHVYVKYRSAESNDFVVNPFFASHLEELSLKDSIEYFNHYRKRAAEFYEAAIDLGYQPKNAAPDKKSDKSREAPLQPK